MTKDPKRWCYRSDQDGHGYLVPIERRREFEAWLDQLTSPEAVDSVPLYARPIDGIESISFQCPLDLP